MLIEHRTTIVLETEAEREHFRRAFQIAGELCNDAARMEKCSAALIRAGLDFVTDSSFKGFRDLVSSVVDGV